MGNMKALGEVILSAHDEVRFNTDVFVMCAAASTVIVDERDYLQPWG